MLNKREGGWTAAPLLQRIGEEVGLGPTSFRLLFHMEAPQEGAPLLDPIRRPQASSALRSVVGGFRRRCRGKQAPPHFPLQ